MIRLIKREFRAWLETNKKVIVGISERPQGCPFCEFLKWKGGTRVSVEFAYRWVDGHVHYHSQWQRRFQQDAVRFERTMGITGIRGQEALHVLDSF